LRKPDPTMKKVIIAATIGLAATIPTVARGDDDRAANQEFKKVLDSVLAFVLSDHEMPMPVDERIRFADAIRKYCSHYRDLIPTLSPSEQEWLNRELGTRPMVEASRRTLAALNSVEHSRAILTKDYDGCVTLTELLAKSDENARVVYLWSGLVYQLIYRDPSGDLANVRQKYGAITEPQVKLSDHNQRSIAATILARIIANDTRPENWAPPSR
jgi:hypothetical protein